MVKSSPREVLSVSAKDSFRLFKLHLIHAHPTKEPGYTFKPSKYLTVRDDDNSMHAIYQLDDDKIIDANPFQDLRSQNIPANLIDRLQRYIDDRKIKYVFGFKNHLYHFYILSEDGMIELPHKPKKHGLRSHGVYFTLKELTSGKKDVEVESSQKK